jgi:hypothetical protein
MRRGNTRYTTGDIYLRGIMPLGLGPLEVLLILLTIGLPLAVVIYLITRKRS